MVSAAKAYTTDSHNGREFPGLKKAFSGKRSARAPPFATEESKRSLKEALDPIVSQATNTQDALEESVPGVVFGVTTADETVYLNHSGVTEFGSSQKVNNDTTFCLYSTTKAVTATAVLILVSRGSIKLDEPVENYYPKFKDLLLSKDGVKVKPVNKVTMRHLLTHTSGFGYTIFSEQYSSDEGMHDIFGNPLKGLLEDSYLLFEPGTAFLYGCSMDWAGVVLQHVAGQSLGEFLKKELFEPLGIHSTYFQPLFPENIMQQHERTPTGSLKVSAVQLHQINSKKVDLHMGGQGLFGTVGDYLKFIRFWLNKGKAPDGTQILTEDVWNIAISNNLPSGVQITDTPSANKHITVDFTACPWGGNKPETWGLSFCRTESETGTGRPLHTLWWSGVGNLFYWIDLENGIGGYYASQVFPCGERSSKNNVLLEREVYKQLYQE